jgi:hypothetical protein
MCIGVQSFALVLNAEFRKLGCLEWRWLGAFIAPTTILAIAVDGASDSPVVHWIGHSLFSVRCVRCQRTVGVWSG